MTRDELRKFVALINLRGDVLYGERVAVLRDTVDERITEHIIDPNASTRKKLSGTVVMVGLGIAEDDRNLAGLQVGDRVTFNKYNTLELGFPTPDGNDVMVDIFHASDIYVGRRPEESLFAEEEE